MTVWGIVCGGRIAGAQNICCLSVCFFRRKETTRLWGQESPWPKKYIYKNKTPASCEDSCAPTPVSAITRVTMTTGKEVNAFIFCLEKALESISQNYFNKIITISCCHRYRAATDFKIVVGVNAFCRTVIWASIQAGEHKKKVGRGKEGEEQEKKPRLALPRYLPYLPRY